MKKSKKQLAADRHRVSTIYARECANIQVPIFSLSKIMDAGLEALNAGGSDADIAKAVVAVVETVRSN